MRFVGQAEVVAFLRDYPTESERLQAWVAEMRHCNWRSVQELTAAFTAVDSSRSPLMVFQLASPPLRIETLIDFRTNVLMLLAIKYPLARLAPHQDRNERRDY